MLKHPNISDEFNKSIHIKIIDKNNTLDLKILKNQNHNVLSSSDVVMLASGTVTLEAALYNIPMIISYKAHYIAYFVYLMIRYIKFLSLPNIIAGEKIIEEFLQHRADADLIALEILSILYNNDKREKMLKNLSILREKLGNKTASYEVAKNISQFLLQN